MTVRLRDFQLAQHEIAKRLNSLYTNKNVLVGIHEDAGMHAPSEPGDDPVSMAQLGALLNYGDETNTLNGRSAPIPPRPWLIPGLQNSKESIVDVIGDAIKKDTHLDLAMEQIGLLVVGEIQQYMTDLRNPPNAPYTIAQKGSSNPLIDTGALRASVTYKVTDQKPDEGI